jgi:hypothetical protein
MVTLGGVGTKQVYQFWAATGGSGRGTFTGSQNLPPPHNSPNEVQFADIDNDGDLDFVTHAFNYVEFGRNNGSGTFTYGASLYLNGDINFARLADFDGDGDLDLIAALMYDNTLSIRLNNGAGVFGGGQDFTTFPAGYIATGDVDGDGDVDVINTRSDVVTLFLNNGSGTFTYGPVTSVAPSGDLHDVHLADLDNDGDLDFVAYGLNSSGTVLLVRLNDGNGAFSGTYALTVASNCQSLALGDMNGDGNPDVVIGNLDTAYRSGLTVLLNDGAAHFTARPRVGRATFSQTNGLVLGDVDADGDLDALFCGQGTNQQEAYVYLNDGQSNLVSVTSVSVDPQPSGLALGDIDGDGDLDFAAVSGYSSTVSIRFNGATLPTAAALAGTVAAPLQLYPNPASEQVTVGVPAGLLTQAGELTLVNGVGQVVHRQSVGAAPAGRQLVLNLQRLPRGFYTVRLTSASGQQAAQRLIIE